MRSVVDQKISLDRTDDVWVGRFAGLGSIRVWPDGRVKAESEKTVSLGDVSTPDERLEALRFGWGEPLSLVRRGFVLAEGCVAVEPTSQQGLLLSGLPHETSIVLLGLVARGWLVLADRVVPLTFESNRVVAHPRTAPMLTSRRRAGKSGLSGRAVRADTTSVAIDVPRWLQPCTIAAVTQVTMHRPNELNIESVMGHARFDVARTLFAGGVLAAPGTTSQQSMNRTLRLASLPTTILRLDSSSSAQSIEGLLSWWNEL